MVAVARCGLAALFVRASSRANSQPVPSPPAYRRSHCEAPTSGFWALIGNIIWVVLAGWWVALSHIITAIPLAITIIGIPFAIANIKMVPVALLPLGKRIVDID